MTGFHIDLPTVPATPPKDSVKAGVEPAESPTRVLVKLPEGLSENTVREFEAFDHWFKTLTASLVQQHTNTAHPFHARPYHLRSVTVQSYDMFGPRLGFLKLTTDVSTDTYVDDEEEGGEKKKPKSDKLPGAVFLRGPSVAMLIILIPDDVTAGSETDDDRYVPLTVQPRVAAGSLEFVELPAGMVEGGEFKGTAAREVQEELGITIKTADLRCLSDMAAEGQKPGNEGLPAAVYPSAGGCDEYIPIYMHEQRVPRTELNDLKGKLTGLREEGEMIKVKLVKMKDLWREGRRDAKCLSALALWEGLQREGKL